jgi:hypothetical protein
VSSPWNERKRGGGREGGREPTEQSQPTGPPCRSTKETIGRFLEPGLGGSEGGRRGKESARWRTRGSVLADRWGWKQWLRICSFFSARLLSSVFFYFVLDGRVGGNGSAAGAPVSTRRGSVTELGRRRRREVGRRTRDGRLRCLGGRVGSFGSLRAGS